MSQIIVENLKVNKKLNFPNYTTTQRNSLTPVQGNIIFNTTTNNLEIYLNNLWQDFSQVNL